MPKKARDIAKTRNQKRPKNKRKPRIRNFDLFIYHQPNY